MKQTIESCTRTDTCRIMHAHARNAHRGMSCISVCRNRVHHHTYRFLEWVTVVHSNPRFRSAREATTCLVEPHAQRPPLFVSFLLHRTLFVGVCVSLPLALFVFFYKEDDTPSSMKAQAQRQACARVLVSLSVCVCRVSVSPARVAVLVVSYRRPKKQKRLFSENSAKKAKMFVRASAAKWIWRPLAARVWQTD